MNTEFTYDDWLASHHMKKNVLDRIKRSLVPWELISRIPLETLSADGEGEITTGGNIYTYKFLGEEHPHETRLLRAALKKKETNNTWTELYCEDKPYVIVLSEKGHILTAYPEGETDADELLSLFDRGKFSQIFKHRCLHVENLLTRYLMVTLCQRFYPRAEPMASRDTLNGYVTLAAAEGKRTWISCSLTRAEALRKIRQCAGSCDDHIAVYYTNPDFESEGAVNGDSRLVNIQEFCSKLKLNSLERKKVEQKVFFLISMIHGDYVNWNIDRLKRIVSNAPDRWLRYKDWQPISRTLLEDALNHIVCSSKSQEDQFHFLAAANIVNARCNYYKHAELNARQRYAYREEIKKMYASKTQIFQTMIDLLEKNICKIKLSLCHVHGEEELTLLAEMNMDRMSFQFRFRGMGKKVIDQLHHFGVKDDGVFGPRYLQPIAPSVYMFSYLYRWKDVRY